MMRHYKANLREFGQVVFHPKATGERPTIERREMFPASLMSDPIFAANVATCQACDNFKVKSCGAAYCKLIGDNRAELLQAITVGGCPIEKLKKTGWIE